VSAPTVRDAQEEIIEANPFTFGQAARPT